MSRTVKKVKNWGGVRMGAGRPPMLERPVPLNVRLSKEQSDIIRRWMKARRCRTASEAVRQMIDEAGARV